MLRVEVAVLAGRGIPLIWGVLLSRGHGEAPPGWVLGGASFLAVAAVLGAGERVVVDAVSV